MGVDLAESAHYTSERRTTNVRSNKALLLALSAKWRKLVEEMRTSASFCKGKGSIAHNNRDFVTANVDKERIKDRILIVVCVRCRSRDLVKLI